MKSFLSKIHILSWLLVGLSFSAYAQEEGKKDNNNPDISVVSSDEKPVIDVGKNKNKNTKQGINANQLVKEGIKKIASAKATAPKKSKDEFMGYKIKKFFIKSEQGKTVTTLTFHYLAEYKEPNPYLDIKYYYDLENKRIAGNQSIVKKENALVLHGDYEKRINNVVVERGQYYIGSKHGRWEEYAKSGFLTFKETYHKGFSKNSIISYHDKNKTKLKEVIPMREGVRHGYYVSVYPSGNIAEEGYYQDGEKVGRWTEYYDHKSVKNRKKELQYAEVPFDKNFKPYTRREWSADGKVTIDNSK